MKFIIAILIALTQISYAVVSIAPVEIGDHKGTTTNIELGLQNRDGNVKKENYNAAIRVTYDNAKDYVTWLEFDGEYGKSNGVENTNESFLHFRYIHTLTNDQKLRYELFSQVESNKFKQINKRTLLGLGVRYNLMNLMSNTKGYFGLAIFNEDITYENSAPAENNNRFNSYLTYSLQLSKQTKLSWNFYYQPKIDDFSDYAYTTKAELTTELFKNVSLKVSLGANEDSNPVSGVKKSDVSQKTTFIFNF